MSKKEDNKKPQSVLKTFVNEAGAFIYEDVILDRVKVTDDTVLIGMYINNPYTLNSALIANNLTTQYNISDVHVPIIVAFHTPSKALAKKLAKSPTFAKNKKIKLAMLATFSEKTVGSEDHRHKQVIADVDYGAFIVIDEEKTLRLESEENISLEKAREKKPVIKTAYDEIIPDKAPEPVVATKTKSTDKKKEHNGFGLKLPKLPSFSLKKEKHEVEDVPKSNAYVPKEENTLADIADEIEPPVQAPEKKVSRSTSLRQEKTVQHNTPKRPIEKTQPVSMESLSDDIESEVVQKRQPEQTVPAHTVEVKEPEAILAEDQVNDIEAIEESRPVVNESENIDNIEIEDPFGEDDIELIDENENQDEEPIHEESIVADDDFVNEIDPSINEEIEEAPVTNKKHASVFSLFGKRKSQSNENNNENTTNNVEDLEDDDDALEVETSQIIQEKEEDNQVGELEEEELENDLTPAYEKEEKEEVPKSKNITEPVDNDIDELKRLLDEI